MVLSDFLAILDIVVTVLIGFVITHMFSVRDSRTRAIKDYYIQELASIKSEIDDFYSKLFKGELEAKDIIGWHSGVRNRVENYDNAVRKAFKIYEANIGQELFRNYKIITSKDDFNANFNKGKIVFKAPAKIAIGKNQKELYMLIERTLYDVNNVRPLDYLSRKRREFKSHYLYYRTTGKKTKWEACWAIVKDWVLSHKSSFLFVAFIIALFYILFVNLGRFVEQERIDTTHQELIERLDSLNAAVKEISIKGNELPAITDPPSTYSIQVNEISSKDTTKLRGWIKATH